MKAMIELPFIVIESRYSDLPFCKSLPGSQWDNARRVWKVPATAKLAALLNNQVKQGIVVEGPSESVCAITIQDGKILATFPYVLKDEIVPLENKYGGVWDKGRRLWMFPATPASAVNLRDNTASLGGLTVHSSVFTDLLSTAFDIDDAQSTKRNDHVSLPFLTKTQPWRHQSAAFDFCKKVPAVLLHLFMGTGKTKIAIDLIINQNDINVLIIAPAYVVRDHVWLREFGQHAGGSYRLVELVGPIKKRVSDIKTILSHVYDDGPTIFVTNYEALPNKGLQALLKKIHWSRIVLDEGHRIKAAAGKISKFLWSLASRSDRRMILSGTPFDSPLDVFALFRFLDEGVYGRSVVLFRNHYAVCDVYKRPIRFINTKELRDKYSRLTFYAGAEVLDLPPEQDIIISTPMETSEQTHYDTMKEDMIIEIREGTLQAKNAIGKLLRLRQITGGWLPLEDDEGLTTRRLRIGMSKERALRELLIDLQGERVIVFAQFTADMDIIRMVVTDLKRDYFEVSGKSKGGIDPWRENNNAVLGCQIDAGSLGIDLTKGSKCIYYSVGFSSITYQQSRRRILRPGQEKPVVFYHLISPSSIDEYVYKILHSKERTQKTFIAAILAEVLNAT